MQLELVCVCLQNLFNLAFLNQYFGRSLSQLAGNPFLIFMYQPWLKVIADLLFVFKSFKSLSL